MQIYYSGSTNGFYEEGDQPLDAVEITTERWQELLAGQSAGKVLSSRGGKPVLTTPEAPSIDPVAARQSAYRQEASTLFMQWQYDQDPLSEKAWRDKMAEIDARYPLAG